MTKLVTKGVGLNQYYFFEEEKEPYCMNEVNIKSYLQNKNNDHNIEDKDAFIVITGKLKIFDYILLHLLLQSFSYPENYIILLTLNHF